MANSIANLAAYAIKRPIAEIVCASIKIGDISYGLTEEEADQDILELARFIEFMPNGRASKHLDHFFAGKGENLYFDTALLINEDKNVRKAITDQVTETISRHPDIKRKSSGTQRGLKIDIKQNVYEDTSIGQDWKNALGSFVFDWDPVQSSQDPRKHCIRVYGQNIYRFHPDLQRWTNCVHRAADRLTKKRPETKNYTMIAKPCLVSVYTWMPIKFSI